MTSDLQNDTTYPSHEDAIQDWVDAMWRKIKSQGEVSLVELMNWGVVLMRSASTKPAEPPPPSDCKPSQLPPREKKWAFYDEPSSDEPPPKGDARINGIDGDATLRDWLQKEHNPLGLPIEGVVAELVRRALHTKAEQ